MSLRVIRWALGVGVVAALQLSLEVATAQAVRPGVQGEAAVPLPRFSVVSVRETKSPIFREELRADGFSGTGVNLTRLIMESYGIPQLDRLVGLPTWGIGKRFDVQAKVDDADVPAIAKLSAPQRRAMLQQVLAERFKLTMHEEERMQPIYLLTAAKTPGPLLQKSRWNDPQSGLPTSPGRVVRRQKRGQLTDERFTMADFANQLAGVLHKGVVDQTNLDGPYDLQLDWNPDDALPAANNSANSNVSDSGATGSSIFTALQEQLGLKLKPSKGLVRVWVIDHVELPSDN